MKRKLAAVVLGLLTSFCLLELGVRINGYIFLRELEQRNHQELERLSEYRILCIGESTTAVGGPNSYPSQLSDILNRRGKGKRFTVINKGVPGGDTSVIMARIEQQLDAYHPNIVVAMMGANDSGGAIPFEGSPVALQTGLSASFKSIKLLKLLWFYATRDLEGAERGRGAYEPDARADGAPDRRPDEQGSMARGEHPVAPRAIGPPLSRPSRPQQPGQFQSDFEKAGLVRAVANIKPHGAKRLTGREECSRHLPALAEAVRQAPFDQVATVQLAICYEAIGDLEAAFREYDNALELDPLAERTHRRLAVLDPENKREYLKLAAFYEDLAAPEQIELLFSKALRVDPKNPFLLGRMALYQQSMGHEEAAEEYRTRSARVRHENYCPMTRKNYRRLMRMLKKRRIRLVSVQYPTRDIAPLKKMLEPAHGVIFVDNELPYKRALARMPYEKLFWDNCYGDFGHGTREGNRILAENVAGAIRELVGD